MSKSAFAFVCLFLIPFSAAASSFWSDHFQLGGEIRQETAVRVASPAGFGKIREFAKAHLKFTGGEHVQVRVGGRAWYDAVYDVTDHYPAAVRKDLRTELSLRDAFVDLSFSPVRLRLGRQQIVWGEALGQFFADAINPKDLREFLLPDFDDVRIPVWAVDLQYHFLPQSRIEAVAVFDPTVDRLAQPGADFAFALPFDPQGAQIILLPDQRPSHRESLPSGGVKLSTLIKGWDLSLFYHTGPDHEPALSKSVSTDPATGATVLTLQPIHRRIHQQGITFSKSVEPVVVRGEFTNVAGHFFNAKDVTRNEGLTRGDQFRYVLGLDYSIGGRVDMNAEFQQELLLSSRNKISDPSHRSWLFFHFQAGLLHEKLVPQLLFVIGLERGDTRISPRLSYQIANPVTLTIGADLFSGSARGLYGQFDAADRIFMNTKYHF